MYCIDPFLKIEIFHSLDHPLLYFKTRFFVEKKIRRYRLTKHLSIIRNIPFEPMRNNSYDKSKFNQCSYQEQT